MMDPSLGEAEAAEFVQRQLHLMARRVAEFEDGKRGIGQVIADLEGLLWTLDGTDEEWFDAFLEQWGELEVDYAVALDRGTPLPDARSPMVGGALLEMKRLIESRLSQAR